MTEHSNIDPYIPYGRGGAGNMRRQSAIRDAWFKIAREEHSPEPITKEESRNSISTSRRRSSTWSTSTAGERRFGWKKLFKRHSVSESDEKIQESE